MVLQFSCVLSPTAFHCSRELYVRLVYRSWIWCCSSGLACRGNPEITNHISPRVRGRYRQFLQDLFIGLVSGFTLLGVSDFATQITIRDARAGSPLSYSQPGTACGPGGCLMVYDPVYIVLDYLFWVGVGFAVVSILRVARVRFVHYSNNDKRPFGGEAS